jgi:hypothetical protein
MNKAYEQGKDAFAKGADIDSNPFEPYGDRHDDWCSWNDGWYDAWYVDHDRKCDAYELGKQSFILGDDVSKNPFSASDVRHGGWAKGWLDEEQKSLLV